MHDELHPSFRTKAASRPNLPLVLSRTDLQPFCNGQAFVPSGFSQSPVTAFTTAPETSTGDPDW